MTLKFVCVPSRCVDHGTAESATKHLRACQRNSCVVSELVLEELRATGNLNRRGHPLDHLDEYHVVFAAGVEADTVIGTLVNLYLDPGSMASGSLPGPVPDLETLGLPHDVAAALRLVDRPAGLQRSASVASSDADMLLVAGRRRVHCPESDPDSESESVPFPLPLPLLKVRVAYMMSRCLL